MTLESGLSNDITANIREMFAKYEQFYVRKNKDGCAVFYTPDKQVFCRTSPIVNTKKFDNGYLELTTLSGHKYPLTTVESCKPVEQKQVSNPSLEVISKKKSSKDINWGDGYDKTAFVFNRPCSKEEFISFLQNEGYKLYETDKWWEDYSTIEGSGTNWTYTWVLAYTD